MGAWTPQVIQSLTHPTLHSTDHILQKPCAFYTHSFTPSPACPLPCASLRASQTLSIFEHLNPRVPTLFPQPLTPAGQALTYKMPCVLVVLYEWGKKTQTDISSLL